MADKLTVLVVDDTPDILFLVSKLLKDIYKVKVANDGKQAVKVATTGTPPDVILLDIMMPEMDGYSTLNALRQSPNTQNTPVIMLTSVGFELNRKMALGMGAADYITKPFDPNKLLACIESVLAKKGKKQ